MTTPAKAALVTLERLEPIAYSGNKQTLRTVKFWLSRALGETKIEYRSFAEHAETVHALLEVAHKHSQLAAQRAPQQDLLALNEHYYERKRALKVGATND